MRISLFEILRLRLEGARVVDLFAGTGSLGLEALSRGASHATLVEQDERAAQVIRRNASELGCEARSTLVRDEVARALPRLSGPFDLVFSDPPYALRAAQETLEALARLGLVAPQGRVVLERDRREPSPSAPDGFELVAERRYGDTAVLLVRRR